MAWSDSRVFGTFIESAFNRTNAFDLNSDAFKAALYNNTITPNHNLEIGDIAESAYANVAGVWVTGAEQTSSTQWPAGGRPLVSPTSTYSATTRQYKFDAADTASNGSATLANVYGCLIYDDTISDYGVCYNYFGGATSVTGGTYTIVWSDNGIFSASP